MEGNATQSEEEEEEENTHTNSARVSLFFSYTHTHTQKERGQMRESQMDASCQFDKSEGERRIWLKLSPSLQFLCFSNDVHGQTNRVLTFTWLLLQSVDD